MKKRLSILLLFISTCLFSQYTETINSNRPGTTQGAFSVGKNVLQFELGISRNSAFIDELDYSEIYNNLKIRYGDILENLEFFVNVDAVSKNLNNLNNSNWKSFDFNIKYLFYDPFKNQKWYKENIYSWKANYRFRIVQLIPAISFSIGLKINNTDYTRNFSKPNMLKYFLFDKKINNKLIAAGINNNYGKIILTNDELLQGVFNVITQNHLSAKWVLVNNFGIVFFGNKFFNQYQYSTTLTHNFNNPKISSFLEYTNFFNKFYSSNQFKVGLAFLLNKNLQLDFHSAFNNSISSNNMYFGGGVSFRIDKHDDTNNLINLQLREQIKKNRIEKKTNNKELRRINKTKKTKRKKFIIF